MTGIRLHGQAPLLQMYVIYLLSHLVCAAIQLAFRALSISCALVEEVAMFRARSGRYGHLRMHV